MNLWLLIPTFIIGLPIVGAIYQAIATARDKRNFPPPGQLIDVGGHRLHLHVTGTDTGKPTVILEAGMASFSSNFVWVQQELEQVTRVVAYDRAGLGWSDSGLKAARCAAQRQRVVHGLAARRNHRAICGRGTFVWRACRARLCRSVSR